MLTKFTDYFEPQKNVTYERHKFNTRTQMQGEHFDIFVTDLKKKAQTCEFGNLGDSLIKDRIVVGIIEDSTRARLLREKNLTLQRAIEICRAAEISKSQIGDMAAGVQSTTTVNALYKQKSKGKRGMPTNAATRQSTFNNPDPERRSCKYCGRQHERGQCPAYGKTYGNCGKQNHFEKVCMSRPQDAKPTFRRNDARTQKIHGINEYSDTDDEFFVDVVGREKSNKANTPDWMINLKIMNRTVRFKVDTGAQCNVVLECVHTKICNKLQRSNDRPVSFSGDRMKPIGKC